MTDSAIVLSHAAWAAITAVVIAGGITQGALGFGFPAVVTPLLAMITDIKTAIILNLLPNFVVNLISVLRGGNWAASLGRYWPVAVWVLFGSFVGASFLVVAPQEPIRLLLALAIFAYLGQGTLARLDWSWLARKPRMSAMVFGLTGGFFSGTVNNSLPPLLIYFMLLGVELTVMTQILNLCFLGGKIVQAATLGAAGAIRVSQALANVPLTLVAVGALWLGTRLQRRVQPKTYNRILRYLLFVIGIVLFWQGAQWFFPSAHAAERPWTGSPHGAMLERILPPTVTPQSLPEPASAGARLTLRYCTQCHHLPNPRMHTAERWTGVIERMVWRMRGNGNMGEVMREMMAKVEAPADYDVDRLKRYFTSHAQKEMPPSHPGLQTEEGQVFSLACSQCHALPDPRQHTAREWPGIVERMKRNMAWANVIVGPPELRTVPELKTSEIVHFLQRYARP